MWDVLMATSVNELPAVDPDSGYLNVVIDTPKGFRNQYRFDEQRGQWRLRKVLPRDLRFPYDFGFLPSTRGEDDDPLDVLVLMDEAAFPGCVVPARLLGVVEAEQTEHGKTVRNDRLIAAVETASNPAPFHCLEQVSRQRLDDIERFFVAYYRVEGRQFRLLGRRGTRHAWALVEQATDRAAVGVRGRPLKRQRQAALAKAEPAMSGLASRPGAGALLGHD
jgi:inorganic pyrophosphatase